MFLFCFFFAKSESGISLKKIVGKKLSFKTLLFQDTKPTFWINSFTGTRSDIFSLGGEHPPSNPTPWPCSWLYFMRSVEDRTGWATYVAREHSLCLRLPNANLSFEGHIHGLEQHDPNTNNLQRDYTATIIVHIQSRTLIQNCSDSRVFVNNLIFRPLR